VGRPTTCKKYKQPWLATVDGGGTQDAPEDAGDGAELGPIRRRLGGRAGKRKALKKQSPRTAKPADWQVRIHVQEAKNLSVRALHSVAFVCVFWCF